MLKSPWPLVVPIKARPEIRQFQIVQETYDHYVVRYVADRALDTDARASISAGFDDVLGIKATVSFELMKTIPRTDGGKFMTALSLLHD